MGAYFGGVVIGIMILIGCGMIADAIKEAARIYRK